MKKLLAMSVVALACATAQAQETKLTFAMSGWTGFAPITLAKEAGIFKKNGLDVTIKKIPQKDRHLAIASGDVQCAATTVETWIAWNANGVPTTQIFQLDKSFGADGMVVKGGVSKISDLKGKTIAASAPGQGEVRRCARRAGGYGFALQVADFADTAFDDHAVSTKAFVELKKDRKSTRLNSSHS